MRRLLPPSEQGSFLAEGMRIRSSFQLEVVALLLFALSFVGLPALTHPTSPIRAYIVPSPSVAFDSSSVKSLRFLKNYSEFQISNGYGGAAEEEAAAVFVKPFEGTDLSTVPYEVFDKLKLAKETVEDMEIEAFEPAIERSGEETATGQALKVGMWKNRVLFATADVQILEIEAAHNRVVGVEDSYEEGDLEFAREYLAWTIQTDRENDGQASLGVT